MNFVKVSKSSPLPATSAWTVGRVRSVHSGSEFLIPLRYVWDRMTGDRTWEILNPLTDSPQCSGFEVLEYLSLDTKTELD